jgi:ribonucleoside-triphosphate reductase
LEERFWNLSNGGKIQYVKYPIDYNIEAVKTLIRRAMDMGFYEGVNLQHDYCEKCRHQFIDSDTCPKCGSEEITRIERMNGYLGYSRVNGRTMYADHKLEEFKDRVSM